MFYFFKLPPVWLTGLSHLYYPRMLRKICAGSDAIVVDFPYVYLFGQQSGREYILNTHNVEEKLWKNRGLVSRITSYYVRKIERNAIKHASCVFCCTLEDEKYFRHDCSLVPKTFKLVPNALNLRSIERFIHRNAKNVIRDTLGIKKDTTLILFSGSSYFANMESFQFIREFCSNRSEILRQLKIKFLVVGSVADKIYDTEFYFSTSTVKNVHSYFSACDAAINPTVSGSGSNIKMSEYIAFKLPIFTTSFGARGFNLEDKLSCYYFDFNTLDRVFLNAFEEKNRNNSFAMANRAYSNNVNLIDMKENILAANLFL